MTWDINTPPEELEVWYGDEWYQAVALYPRKEGTLVIYENTEGFHGAVVRFCKEDHIRRKRKKHKRWMNYYPIGTESYCSRAAADSGATRDRIACIEVEFEEGEGL